MLCERLIAINIDFSKLAPHDGPFWGTGTLSPDASPWKRRQRDPV